MEDLTFEENSSHKLQDKIKLFFPPTMLFLQFLDLLRLLSAPYS